jgi:hypothetical protein
MRPNASSCSMQCDKRCHLLEGALVRAVVQIFVFIPRERLGLTTVACVPSDERDGGTLDLAALHRSYKMMENDKVRYMEESKNIIKRQTQVWQLTCWLTLLFRAPLSANSPVTDHAISLPGHRKGQKGERETERASGVRNQKPQRQHCCAIARATPSGPSADV